MADLLNIFNPTWTALSNLAVNNSIQPKPMFSLEAKKKMWASKGLPLDKFDINAFEQVWPWMKIKSEYINKYKPQIWTYKEKQPSKPASFVSTTDYSSFNRWSPEYMNKKIWEAIDYLKWQWLTKDEALEVINQTNFPKILQEWWTIPQTITQKPKTDFLWYAWEKIEQKIWSIQNPAIRDITQKAYNIPVTVWTPIKTGVEKLMEWSTLLWKWVAEYTTPWMEEQWKQKFKKSVVSTVSWWVQTGFNIFAPIATQAFNVLSQNPWTAPIVEKISDVNNFIGNTVAKIPWISDFRSSLDQETQQEFDSTLWMLSILWIAKGVKWIPELINKIKSENPVNVKVNLKTLNDTLKWDLQDKWYKFEVTPEWLKTTEYTPAPIIEKPKVWKESISDLQKAFKPRQEIKQGRIVRKQADIDKQYNSVMSDFQNKWIKPENVRDFVDKWTINQKEIYSKYLEPAIKQSWAKIDINPILDKIEANLDLPSQTLAPAQVKAVKEMLTKIRKNYSWKWIWDLELLKQTTNSLTDWGAVWAEKVFNNSLKELSTWIWELMDNVLDTIKWEKISYWKKLYWDYSNVLKDANKTLVKIEWQSPVWLFEWLGRLQWVRDIFGWIVDIAKWQPWGLWKIASWAGSLAMWKALKIKNDPNNLVWSAFSKQKLLRMAEAIWPKEKIIKQRFIPNKKNYGNNTTASVYTDNIDKNIRQTTEGLKPKAKIKKITVIKEPNKEAIIKPKINIKPQVKPVSTKGTDLSKSWKTLAFKNNNPWNLRDTWFGWVKWEGWFQKYATVEEWIKALNSKIKNAQTGKSSVYKPDMTIQQFINKYAPPSENNSAAYANFLAKELWAKTSTKIKDLDTQKFANAIMKHENRAMYNELEKRWLLNKAGTAEKSVVKPNPKKAGYINPWQMVSDVKKIGKWIKNLLVPKENASLISEAKKYKSFDEFKKDITAYHWTNQKFNEFDIELWWRATSNMPSAKWNVFFTKDKQEALAYAKSANKSQMVNQKEFDNWANTTQTKIEQLQKQWKWDEADILTEKFEDEYYSKINKLQSWEQKWPEIVMERYIDPTKLKTIKVWGKISAWDIIKIIETAKKEWYKWIKLEWIIDAPNEFFPNNKWTTQIAVWDKSIMIWEPQLKQIYNQAHNK